MRYLLLVDGILSEFPWKLFVACRLLLSVSGSFFNYEKKVETAMVNNSTNINKTTITSKQRWSTIPPILTKQQLPLNSDGQQFHQY